MNQYKISLGMGHRMVFANSHTEAFESLGYGNDYKSLSDGYKQWEIRLNGSIGHQRTYYVKQL